MKLASIVQHYLPDILRKNLINSEQLHAANSIINCRTPECGYLKTHCESCDHSELHCHSCGHRSCPGCGQHTTQQWLERQTVKVMPCEYFMVTFTLPKQLRSLAQSHPKEVFSVLFDAANDTLKTFANRAFGNTTDLGHTAVLHTHTRRLDCHPHVHCIVPGGFLYKNCWVNSKNKYLFNAYALAKVFKAIFKQKLNAYGLLSKMTPRKWVVHCKHVGQGLPALKYLSRYVYRGVISEKNIVSNDGVNVTFTFKNSKTNRMEKRTLPGASFVLLILQHVLPKGFRRLRDYGYLHGNAKRKRQRVQLALHVKIPILNTIQRPKFLCPHCQGEMTVVATKMTRVILQI